MAVIKSGATTDQLTIDPTSKAARVTLYDTAGALRTNALSYVAAVIPTASAAGTGILFDVRGSATKTVRVSKIVISATVATAEILGAFLLYKRTVAATGGTAVPITPVALDSGNAAATATANLYSALATAGTGGGIIDMRDYLFPTIADATIGSEASRSVIFEAPGGACQDWVLRGTAQTLEIRTLATVANTPTYGVACYFTEE